MQETQVLFLDWEDPLEKEMAIHPSILALKIPWGEESGRLHSMGSEVRHDLETKPPPYIYAAYERFYSDLKTHRD